jgi:hypothetical protein
MLPVNKDHKCISIYEKENDGKCEREYFVPLLGLSHEVEKPTNTYILLKVDGGLRNRAE